MSRQILNRGSAPNARDGDPLNEALAKFDDNDAELYAGNLDALAVTQAVSGVPAGDALGAKTINKIVISSDTVTAPDNNLNVFGHVIDHHFGGVGCKGYRIASADFLTLESTPDATSYGGYYTATWSWAKGKANAGGTSLANGSSKGSIFGSNSQVTLYSGATYYSVICGAEIDIGVLPGASVRKKIGINITTIGSDAVAGSAIDAAVVIGSVAGASPKWSDAFLLSNHNGAAPLNSTGNIMRSDVAFSCANGVDLSNVSFSGDAFKSNGFAVDGDGKISGGLSGFKITADGSIVPV